jgi:hypothetical protein
MTRLVASLHSLRHEVTATPTRAGRNDAIHLRLVLQPLELAALPLELADAPNGLPGAGQPLCLQSQRPVIITRETHRLPPRRVRWPSEPKVLFAWAAPAASGLPAVPWQAHLMALTRALAPWLPSARGAERWLRQGEWLKGQFEPTASLRERTIGILGLGRIGKAIARRAEAFGVKVIYHNRKPDPSVNYAYCDSLLEMARRCDILMIAAPGGPQTKNIVNREVIEALGPDGILVNIARGTLVDESALIKALKEKRILTAALDVFADEPRVPPELMAMDHVILLLS